MSFDAYESSVQDGRPIELYRISHGPEVWRLTTAELPITYLAETYTPTPASRGPLRVAAQLTAQRLELTLPPDHPVAELFLGGPPEYVVDCTLRRLHRHDPDAEAWAMPPYRLLSATWREGAGVTVYGESLMTALNRVGLHATYSATCRHVLYRGLCGADPEAHALDGSVSAITAQVVTVPGAGAQPDGWWTGGYLAAAGGTRRRGIIDHAGSQLELVAPLAGLAVGSAVRLYPGCDRSWTTCGSKFARRVDFGGLPFAPARTPQAGI